MISDRIGIDWGNVSQAVHGIELSTSRLLIPSSGTERAHSTVCFQSEHIYNINDISSE